jgi:hypothetical protein
VVAKLTAPALSLLLLCGAPPAAHAETEGFAYACPSGMCFWRRPVVEPPPGWVRDETAGQELRFNAFARKGEEFMKADAVLYANAQYRKNAPPTLAGQIAADRERILKGDPKANIVQTTSVRNGDAKTLVTFAFVPGRKDESWETVAYDEEGDYYLRFVLSAQTKEAHDKALSDFAELVRGYTRMPRKP